MTLGAIVQVHIPRRVVVERREIPASPLHGKRGCVVQTEPTILVVLDDDPRAILFGRDELVVLETPAHHGGAE